MIDILQIPTNVTPNDEVVNKYADTTNYPPIFSFTFNGEQMRWVNCSFVDTQTDEITCSFGYSPSTTVTNGDNVTIPSPAFASNVSNGKNYKYRYIIYQGDAINQNGKYDIYLCRGKIRTKPSSDTDGNTSVYIGKNINNIKNKFIHDDVVIGGCYLEVGSERRMISEYNSTTGKVIIDSAFTTYPTVNTSYKIYTNYIISPYYLVKVRSHSNIGITIEHSPYHFAGSLSYNQNEHIGIKCYKLKIYRYNSLDYICSGALTRDSYGQIYLDANTTSEQANQIYNGSDNSTEGKCIMINDTYADNNRVRFGYRYHYISYNSDTRKLTLKSNLESSIENNYKYTIYSNDDEKVVYETDWIYSSDMNFNVYEYITAGLYRFEYTIVNQEDMSVTKNGMFEMIDSPSSLVKAIEDDNWTIQSVPKSSAVGVFWRFEGDDDLRDYGRVILYRKDLNDETIHPQVIRVVPSQIDTRENIDTGTYGGCTYDYTAGKGNYRYYLRPYIPEGSTLTQPPDYEITYNNSGFVPSYDGWFISSLRYNRDLYGKPVWIITETWNFQVGIQEPTITTNLGVQVHTSNGIKPCTSRNILNYESGSFSALLSTLTCTDTDTCFEDDISKINKWKRFITQDTKFLLKSTKGDAWIVNISNSPTRQYDNSCYKLLTTITYDWVECDKISEVIINKADTYNDT